MLTKQCLGYTVPPSGQFIYSTKLLFLLPIAMFVKTKHLNSLTIQFSLLVMELTAKEKNIGLSKIRGVKNGWMMDLSKSQGTRTCWVLR